MVDKINVRQKQVSRNELRRFYLRAGAAYGLIFGIGFILMAWGLEAVRLAIGGASLSWAKLLVALMVVPPIATLAGWISGWSLGSALAAMVWGMTGAFFGYFSGHLPYEGVTRFVWLVEPRLNGLALYPYGYAGTVRTTLVLITGAGIGIVVGFFQSQVVQWAWDRSIKGIKMSLASWLSLLACLPLAFIFALIVDQQVNKPLREPLESTIALIELGLGPEEAQMAPDSNIGALRKFATELTDDYQIHLVGYNLSNMSTAYTDVIFSNGLRLRCTTVRVETSASTKHQALNCVDFEQQLKEWMSDLAYAGLYGERRWLTDDWQKLVVKDEVLRWLRAIRMALDEQPQITKIEQLGNWIFVNARYGEDFEMTCRIQVLIPSVIEECWPANQRSTTLAQEASQRSSDLATQEEYMPGVEVIPLQELSPRIPWLPFKSGKTPAVSFIVFNLNYSYLNNRTVRQALAMATDRTALVLRANQVNANQAQLKQTFVLPGDERGGPEVYQGWRAPNIQFYINSVLNSVMSYQRPRAATSFIHPDVLGRDLYGEIGLAYNPPAAQAMLAEAGYPNGQDFPVLRLLYIEGEMSSALLQEVTEDWQQVLGIQVELIPMNMEDYLLRVEKGDLQLYFGGWAGEYYDPEYFLGAFIRTPAPNWRDPNSALLQMVDAAAEIPEDPEARQALYIQAEKLLTEDEVLIIPLIHHTIDQ